MNQDRERTPSEHAASLLFAALSLRICHFRRLPEPPDCRKAIDEFRRDHGIREEIHRFDERRLLAERSNRAPDLAEL
jgi:hypothetical protein